MLLTITDLLITLSLPQMQSVASFNIEIFASFSLLLIINNTLISCAISMLFSHNFHIIQSMCVSIGHKRPLDSSHLCCYCPKCNAAADVVEAWCLQFILLPSRCQISHVAFVSDPTHHNNVFWHSDIYNEIFFFSTRKTQELSVLVIVLFVNAAQSVRFLCWCLLK